MTGYFGRLGLRARGLQPGAVPKPRLAPRFPPEAAEELGGAAPAPARPVRRPAAEPVRPLPVATMPRREPSAPLPTVRPEPTPVQVEGADATPAPPAAQQVVSAAASAVDRHGDPRPIVLERRHGKPAELPLRDPAVPAGDRPRTAPALPAEPPRPPRPAQPAVVRPRLPVKATRSVPMHEPRRDEARIDVHIGRVEVQAPAGPLPQPPPAPLPPPALDDTGFADLAAGRRYVDRLG